MKGDAWSPEENRDFARMFDAGMSWDEIAAAFPDRTPKAVRCKWERALRKQGAAAADPPAQTRELRVSGDRATAFVEGLTEEVQCLEDLYRVCRIDRDAWAVEDYVQKAYQGFHKTGPKGSERAVKVQLFSVSVRLKARVLQNAVRDELRALIDEARAEMPPPLRIARPDLPESGYLVSVNLTDLHMGKYAWGKESGDNYDVAIAERLLWEAVDDLLKKLESWPVELFVLTIGSDLLNADNSENLTTGGTPQTTDGRQSRTFRRTWQLMRKVILRLREVAPVRGIVVNGNHDRDASFAIGEVLSVAFEGWDDVAIDNGAARRKYIEWGACLIGYDHGDEVKPKDLPGVVAEECAEAWGRTRYRCVETGHLHQQRVTEYPGLVVRVNPAICAPEDWHAAKGFIGKIRALHAQIWHREDGNVAQLSSAPIRPARANIYRAA